MTNPEMEGVDVSKVSLAFHAMGDVFKAEGMFMACGTQDPALGPWITERLVEVWKHGCCRANIQEGGHFLQEWGDEVAKLAIQVFEAKGG
jgi:haloalkane dehalogenase